MTAILIPKLDENKYLAIRKTDGVWQLPNFGTDNINEIRKKLDSYNIYSSQKSFFHLLSNKDCYEADPYEISIYTEPDGETILPHVGNDGTEINWICQSDFNDSDKALIDGYTQTPKNSEQLLCTIKERLPLLRHILKDISGHWGYEDLIYRFYHTSFKVYWIQGESKRIIKQFERIGGNLKINNLFNEIKTAGTGKKFDLKHNEAWSENTRPMLEAFFHAKFFLEMIVKYGEDLPNSPDVLPSGWAAVLSLYGLR